MLDGEDCSAFVVSSDQTILYWSKEAERAIGHRAADVVGRRCYDIPNDPGGGLIQECQGGCPSIRYLRAGLVPAQCQMRMSSLSGDRKWSSAAPMVAAGFGGYNLLIYLLDEAPEGNSGIWKILWKCRWSRAARWPLRMQVLPPIPAWMLGS